IVQSMTGFSRASEENERLRLEVAIRSVNHRHLDVTVRVPEELREHESLVRKVVAEGLTRGRVEVRIDALYLNNEKPQLEVEESAIEALRATIDDLAAKGLIVSELSFTDLLKVPGAVRTSSVSTAFEPEDVELLRRAVGKALDGVVVARRTEGDTLKGALERMADQLRGVVDAVEAGWQGATTDLPERLRARLDEVLQGNAGHLDETRLAQELAILAERGDVQEELDRLRAHLGHFRELIDQDGEAIGKRLDFLAQEIFRELSTLAAKFRDPEAVQRVIDGKLVCEQIREQVQNIE
ncbi:MAG: YicC/YloC family endoribonuclease, partial [Thermoanaerobaculia bacterium]